MSQNSKNGNILSFFKPKPAPAPAPRPKTPLGPPDALPNPPFPSPSPLPPSSPLSLRNTPVKARTPLRRKVEIQASDDDDDFGASSDDSLEDLSTILGRGRPRNAVPSPSKQQHNPFTTPKAKRKAGNFHSSPLAFLPKHKFDLKALAKDARLDDATHASSMRVKAVDEVDEEEDDVSTADASRTTFEGIVNEKSGHDAQKVLRAVQRTNAQNSQPRYCFFRQEGYAPSATKPAPKSLSKGPWKILTQGDAYTREQHLASGLPLTILQMQGSLPDELFNWILDDLCIQSSSLMRTEYRNLLMNSTEQIERMMTPKRLQELFLRLGASDEIGRRDSELSISRSGQEPYENRDWSCLGSFLILVRDLTPCMSLPSVTYAAQMLLRMSLDKVLIYHIDLLTEYQNAIDILIDAIPGPSWDSFCLETCTLLHTIIKPQSLRIHALAYLPISKAKVHDLRRRLAVTLLFDDPALGRYHPDDTVTLRGIIDCLAEDDFAVGPRTDFAELRASIILLDIAVDDGSFVASGSPDDEKKFNEEVDELAVRLRHVWRKINDSGMKLARTEAKSVIEWVQQRLSHSVRTRRKAKKSVFDIPGQDDPSLPRQQNFMKTFLKKPTDPASATNEDSAVAK
ncbi:hypothetical protein G7046_g7218 [Stylonectria norvegica]|nr:hypothetical protein G7046_g7218 [Stylonectria norvegica]